MESAYAEPMESDDMEMHEEVLDEGDLDTMDADMAPDDTDVDLSLEGSLDPRSLAKMLPDVTDVNRFINAVHKVQKGDVASLSMMETRELAHAFISLLKDNPQSTMRVFAKLKSVHSRDDEMDM